MLPYPTHKKTLSVISTTLPHLLWASGDLICVDCHGTPAPRTAPCMKQVLNNISLPVDWISWLKPKCLTGFKTWFSDNFISQEIEVINHRHRRLGDWENAWSILYLDFTMASEMPSDKISHHILGKKTKYKLDVIRAIKVSWNPRMLISKQKIGQDPVFFSVRLNILISLAHSLVLLPTTAPGPGGGGYLA